MPKAKIIVSDVLDGLRGLHSGSVQCVITSPPYWGLRDYGTEGQLGLESTPEEYVERMTEVFREVRRVLRGDGVCFVNMGDSYASNPASGGAGQQDGGEHQRTPNLGYTRPPGLKPKDLVGIPWRLAFALQADGWWLRSDIIWAKPNPMPESVTDRPTKAHEYVFLLTKAAKYYWDQEAVREAPSPSSFERWGDDPYTKRRPDGEPTQAQIGGENTCGINPAGRNIRTVWTIPTAPFPEAHFATFPPALVEPMVKAGTSEKGACPECGAPWGRVVEKEASEPARKRYAGKGHMGEHRCGGDRAGGFYPNSTTTGWAPSCECGGDPIPCSVLDPFSGAGTTGLVALRFGRDYIGIELNPEYAAMSRKRIRADAPLFNEVS